MSEVLPCIQAMRTSELDCFGTHVHAHCEKECRHRIRCIQKYLESTGMRL